MGVDQITSMTVPFITCAVITEGEGVLADGFEGFPDTGLLEENVLGGRLTLLFGSAERGSMGLGSQSRV